MINKQIYKSDCTTSCANLQEGFTLIEMLVVISLIGILAALALVSFGGAQKQARDTTRKSDLKQYQTSVEGYANKNGGLYPVYANAITLTGSIVFCGSTQLNIGTCIADPKTGTLDYKYVSTDGISYVFWGTLENKTNTWWVVCSNGKTGEKTGSAPSSSSSTCPI